ncbi:MAG: AAA family ATPase [Aurantimonas endophytica]|uniref:AAA family ATPase n=1 Tax=Aurantimonas endophytica TaxID=1522175 RepID=UPI0030025402
MSALSEVNEPLALPIKRRGNITRSSDTVDLEKIVEDVRNPADDRDRYVVDGVIPNGLTLLYGPSGCGKTGIAINLALAVASGLPWAGIPVKQGGVIYLPAEDYHGVCERLAAASVAAGIDKNGAPLWVKRYSNEALSLREDAKNMFEVTGFPTRLVVVDTLSAAFVDEDQDRAAGATKIMHYLQVIHEALKCAVLVVHHPGKGGGKQPTGSGVFFNRSDVVIRAEKSAGFTALTVDKRRDGRTGAAFRYEIAGHPFETRKETLDVQVIKNVRPMTEGDHRAGEDKQKRREQTDANIASARLRELARNGPVSLKAWQASCYDAWPSKPSDRAKSQAFSKAKIRLVEDKEISIEGDRVTVTVTSVTGDDVVTAEPDPSVSPSASALPPLGGCGDETRDREMEGKGGRVR